VLVGPALATVSKMFYRFLSLLITKDRYTYLLGGVDEVLRAELHRVVLLAGRVRDDGGLSAESVGEQYTVVTKSTTIYPLVKSPCLGVEITYSPTIPTFLPGPAPSLRRGEYTVIPAQSMLAARFVSMLSGILKAKYSWARTWLEKPPWEIVPSG
jgi:hypothetical protein